MVETIGPAEALKRAVDVAGSQSAFAKLIGVRQPAVSKWLRDGKRLPGDHVLTIEAATGVSKHDLRPDLYPRQEAAPAQTPNLTGMEPAR